MAGLLSGLSELGLGSLENMSIYEEAKKDKEEKAAAPVIQEKDLILDKKFECPVCGKEFFAKIMKTGKAKLLGVDSDLRSRYEGIDAVKYDVIMCQCCGYAALSRYYTGVTSGQAKLIRENISQKVQLHHFEDEVYSYEEAMERYKLALANAVVKRARNSEKAYICLKSAWLLRGYQESLNEDIEENRTLIAQLKAEEDKYLLNAYNGFVEARQGESFPICGMDEITIDYLLAVLAFRFKKYDVASKMVSGILTSNSANARMKEKARELKEQILAEIKSQKK